MNEKSKNLISGLIWEAESYSSMNQVEKLVENGSNLANLPIQPLYLITRTMPNDAIAEYLPNFSKEQREAFLDIDLWDKDNLDIESFSRWPKIYDQCKNDDVINEFILSEEFLLFLKGRFNIYTFDIEDPMYPDHDNYFLTGDSLLLFEFDDENEVVEEVQNHIKRLYALEGTENAYTRLFKMVSDTFLNFIEEEYNFKKGRLQDFGFVDYYDAIGIYSAFPTIAVMNNFIKKIKKETGNIDSVGLMQALHKSSLAPYKGIEHDLERELEQVTDQKRKDFLQFNFMKLINGSITFNDSLKVGAVAMGRVGKETKSILELGFDYVKGHLSNDSNESLFDYFNFIDLFRIGNTLILEFQKKLKKQLVASGFNEGSEYFLGDFWNRFLDQSLDGQIQIVNNKKTSLLNKIKDYKRLQEKSKTLIDLLPFVAEFKNTFFILRDEGRLNDSFYLNYKVSEIDFEAIILSGFANFMLGHTSSVASPKMGLRLDEFKSWIKMITENDQLKKSDSLIINSIEQFRNLYGLETVYRFKSYLQELLSVHIEGYDYSSMSNEDYKHVGGVVLLI